MIYGVLLFSAVSSVHERTFRSTRKSPKTVMPHLVIIHVFHQCDHQESVFKKHNKQCIITLFMMILPCNHAVSESPETAVHGVRVYVLDALHDPV